MKYLLLLVVMAFTTYGQNFPSHNGYVNDFANVITDNDESIMKNVVYNYEQQTSIEIAIVTINNLQGEVIETYATGLFNTWGIGKKGVNDGVLIFLSLDESDRGLRIEVGYGLEEFLTDFQCSETIDDVMPLLKSGDYSTALSNVVMAVKETVGSRSKEMRDQYLAQREKEREEQAEQIVFVLLISFGIVVIVGFFVFLYKAYTKRQKRKANERKFKNNLLTTVANLSLQIADWIKYAKALEADGFAGADEAVSKLVRHETRINNEFPKLIKNENNHERILSISKDVDGIVTNSNEMLHELQKNKGIDTDVRKHLENKIDTLEQQILRTMPDVKDTINRVNRDNPQTIWRGFNYSDADRQVENFINKAKQSVRESLGLLDRRQFDSANDKATSALKSMNNAYIFVQSIFDVEKQLNASKEQYNKYMANIPKLIKDTEQAVAKQHVKSSTLGVVDTIKQRYAELKAEIAKNDKTIDWILIGALIISIVNGCTDATSRSIKDIKDYQDEQEREERRARRRREESSRSNYSSGYSSFGGDSSFGGGMSGGGGSTGRF